MTPKIEPEEIERLKIRFVTRAQAVFWVRAALMVLGLIILLIGERLHAFIVNPLGPFIWIWLLAVFCCALGAYFFASHIQHGRRIYFVTLSLDLAWYAYLIIVSGGLASPFMAVGPIYTLLFAILFHSPIAITPPLLVLPFASAFSALVQEDLPLLTKICILTIYAFLNGIVIYLTNTILSHEESQSREIFRLERKLKTLAVLEERQRLSRDIHDGLGAALSGLIIQSEYLLTISRDHPAIGAELRELKSAAEDAIDELRRTLSMMREEFDLVPQLQNCCAVFSTRHRLPARLMIMGQPPQFSAEQQLTVFRIMQECLTNISKHAHARQVNVDVNFAKKTLEMNIQDDGVGFDPQIIPKHHYGLLTLKERAKKIGGDIVIDSAPGKGTRVCLTIA